MKELTDLHGLPSRTRSNLYLNLIKPLFSLSEFNSSSQKTLSPRYFSFVLSSLYQIAVYVRACVRVYVCV